jgi:hypothetical protein
VAPHARARATRARGDRVRHDGLGGGWGAGRDPARPVWRGRRARRLARLRVDQSVSCRRALGGVRRAAQPRVPVGAAARASRPCAAGAHAAHVAVRQRGAPACDGTPRLRDGRLARAVAGLPGRRDIARGAPRGRRRPVHAAADLRRLPVLPRPHDPWQGTHRGGRHGTGPGHAAAARRPRERLLPRARRAARRRARRGVRGPGGRGRARPPARRGAGAAVPEPRPRAVRARARRGDDVRDAGRRHAARRDARGRGRGRDGLPGRRRPVAARRRARRAGAGPRARAGARRIALRRAAHGGRVRARLRPRLRGGRGRGGRA